MLPLPPFHTAFLLTADHPLSHPYSLLHGRWRSPGLESALLHQLHGLWLPSPVPWVPFLLSFTLISLGAPRRARGWPPCLEPSGEAWTWDGPWSQQIITRDAQGLCPSMWTLPNLWESRAAPSPLLLLSWGWASPLPAQPPLWALFRVWVVHVVLSVCVWCPCAVHMCIHMHVCVIVFMSVCTQVCVHLCLPTCLCGSMCVHVTPCVSVYVSLCVAMCLCIQLFICGVQLTERGWPGETGATAGNPLPPWGKGGSRVQGVRV